MKCQALKNARMSSFIVVTGTLRLNFLSTNTFQHSMSHTQQVSIQLPVLKFFVLMVLHDQQEGQVCVVE